MTTYKDNWLLALTCDIAKSYVANTHVSVRYVSDLVSNIHASLDKLGEKGLVGSTISAPLCLKTAKLSVQRDYIICFEDGMHFRTLKRHLMGQHGKTAEDYREKWDQPANYLMVASSYLATRKEIAITLGLDHHEAGRSPHNAKFPRSSLTGSPSPRKAFASFHFPTYCGTHGGVANRRKHEDRRARSDNRGNRLAVPRPTLPAFAPSFGIAKRF